MISAITQIKLGLSSYSKSFSIIKKQKMMKYMLIPIVLNIILIIITFKAGSEVSDWINELVKEKFQLEQGTFLNGLINSSINILVVVLSYIAFVYIGGNIIIALMSPIYSLMSEKVDTALTGREFGFDGKQMIKDLFRGLLLAVRNTIIEILWTILCFFLGFVPIIGFLSPIILFFVNSYFFGFAFADYTNERNKLTQRQRVDYVKKHKYMAITIGAVYAASFYLFCGTFLAVLIGGISTVAATISQLEIEKL